MGFFKKNNDNTSANAPRLTVRRVTCFTCDGSGKLQEELFVDPGGYRPSVPEGATWIKTFNCPECKGQGKVSMSTWI
jgi:DnaJ-class molecular chaperone